MKAPAGPRGLVREKVMTGVAEVGRSLLIDYVMEVLVLYLGSFSGTLFY